MARDGLGNFNLSEPPFVYDTTILEDVMNNVLSDIASGLTQSISRDGQTLPTAPLPMGGYRHTGVGNASARNQYAAAGQVQDGAFTWCGTAGGTANALTLAPSPAVVAYVAGQRFLFTAAAANTDAVTVAVSGLAATAVQNAGAALVSGNIAAGRLYLLAYDGSAFQISDISLTPAAPVQATETVSGISRQATIAEAESGTSTTPEAKPHVTPEGLAAALAPVSEAVEGVDGRVGAIEGRLGYSVLYPGGTEAVPGTISSNQRVVIDNPFGAVPCLVEAEIQINGVWGWSGHHTNQSGTNVDFNRFVHAAPVGSSIVVQSGNSGVASPSAYGGSPLVLSTYPTTAPYRVKIWKLAGAA